MIVGFDSDDANIFREQYEFLQAAGIPLVMSGMLVAPHKTPLWKRLEEDGRLWSEEGFANNFASTNVVPKQMSRKQLFEGYSWLIQKLYTPEAYEERLMTAMESIDTRVASGARFGAVDVKPAELWKLAKICFFFMFHRDERVRSLFWRMARVVARAPAERVGDVAFHLACYAHFERYVSKDLMPQLNLRIRKRAAQPIWREPPRGSAYRSPPSADGPTDRSSQAACTRAIHQRSRSAASALGAARCSRVLGHRRRTSGGSNTMSYPSRVLSPS
jgi:hypothetical protein